ncbi:MAG: methyltransferase domain-containing protein [Burkholderiales bacterium]|nr:methyltransferase domain-containing protein [Burkholderiales bacterium]GIK85988.1 MAG: methyltransferase UbiE [Betaproteobacteria bacterium]
MAAYRSLCQRFFDADKGFADDAEVAWYASRLPRAAGPVLEAMCGSGRLLVPLARAGLHVHGVDDAAAMLAACEARLAAEGLAAPLFRQDLAALNLPFRYAAAFVAAGSLQLFADPRAMRSALERLRAHLVAPALLLLDLVVPDVAQHPPGAPLVEVRAVRLPDGARITLRSETTVDVDNRRLGMRNRYELRTRDGAVQREDEALAMTWLDEEEIGTILRGAGFGDVAILPPAWARGMRGFGVSARAAP